MKRQRFASRVLVVVLMLGLFSVSVTEPPKAKASTGVFASELTQLANNVQLVQADITQAEQYAMQLRQLEQELTNGKALEQQLFQPIQQDLAGLQSIVQGGQSVSYAMGNLDQAFLAKFGGYGYRPTQNFAQNYATWSQTTLDSVQHALSAAGLQNSQFTSEQGLVSQYNTMSQSSAGVLQAIQVGNQIASQEVSQLMKLRELMMADLQAKSSYQASQVQMAADSVSSANTFFQLKTGAGSALAAPSTPLGDNVIVAPR